MWGIIVDNARGFAVGLVVGFALSRMLVRMEIAVVARQPRRPAAARLFVIFLVSTMLFVAGAYTGFEVLQRKYSCLDSYANRLYDSLTPRQESTQTLQDRQGEIFVAVQGLFDAQDGTLAEQRAAQDALKTALEDYNTADQELTVTRSENPYPDPPREVC